jgi:hypothetical protein
MSGEAGKVFTLPAGVTYHPAPRRYAVTVSIDGRGITFESDTIEGVLALRKAAEAEPLPTADTPTVRENHS